MTSEINFDVKGFAVESLLNKVSRFTAGDILVKYSRIKPENIAVEFEGRQWSYAELNEEVNKFARSLIKLGISRGDRVAILSENRVEYCVAIYAVAKIGAILSALNLRVTERELRDNIVLTTPEAILVSGPCYDQLYPILKDLPFLKNLILLDNVNNKAVAKGIGYFNYIDMISVEDPYEIYSDKIHMEDGVLILYTSGTTGSSKGAIISHRALIARAHLIATTLKFTEDDTFIAWPPMCHMAAIEQIFAIHSLGGKVIITSRFDPGQICEILEKEPVGWLILMPGTIQPLIDELKQRNTNVVGVKLVGDMADLVPPEQLAEITSLLNAPFVNTYGSTETGSAPATNNLIPIGVTSYKLSKKESPFCEARIVDEDGNDLPIGVPGEVIVRGPTLFSGYWNDPETNERDFRDGWFHTGDVLVRNPDGSLDFVDRLKYMIKSGGENIYPAEIERVLKEYPGVQEAVVVRKKDEKWGEVPKAFIAAEHEIDKKSIIDFCYQHLVRYKVPKSIEIIPLEKFPRNFMGKIMRSELEKMG